MKRKLQIGILIVVSFLLIGCGLTTDKNSIVGMYKDVNPEREEYVEFTTDGKMNIYRKGRDPIHATYKTDSSQSPMHLDIKMPDPSGKTQEIAAIYRIEENRGLSIRFANSEELSKIRLKDWNSVKMPEGYQSRVYIDARGVLPADYKK